MNRYVVRKLIFSVLALLVLVSLESAMFRVLAPYEPRRWIGEPPNPEWELRKQFGWDQPPHIRCVTFIVNMFRFNFGRSFINLQPVNKELWRHLPYTLLLFVPAFIFLIVVSVPLEIYSLTRKGRTFKMKLVRVGASLLTWAVPAKNRLLNAHLEDYLFLRRAVGFDEHITIYRLMLTNMLPLGLVVMAFFIPYLILGTILAEHLLSLKGIGAWYTKSLWGWDRPVIEAILFVYIILAVSARFLISLISAQAR